MRGASLSPWEHDGHRYVSAGRYISAGPTERTVVDQKLAENPPKDSASTEGRSSGEAMRVVREGSRAHKKGDYAEALRLFRLAAEQGEADAQSWLGLMYSLGHGVTQSNVEACRWFRLAAEQGEPWAQYRLGMMYEKGHGVGQDYAEAFRLFRLAAEQDEAGAQRQLGDMYEFGWGIEKNIPMARHWYELAAGQGDPLAQNALRLMGSE